MVEKDGHWFTLNNSQLELCRRLEQEGSCTRVKVDVVPTTEVPEDVRRMMVVPEKLPDKLLVENEKDSKKGLEKGRVVYTFYDHLNKFSSTEL